MGAKLNNLALGVATFFVADFPLSQGQTFTKKALAGALKLLEPLRGLFFMH